MDELNPFEVTEIISINKNHSCLYLLLESSKKMSVVVHPTNVFDYFNNIVDQDKAKQLHSFSIARSICHIAVQIIDHSDNYQCYRVSCRICRLLLTVLLSRKHEKLLCIIKKSN